MAGPWPARAMLAGGLAGRLQAAGHTVTSSWLYETAEGEGLAGPAVALPDEAVAEHAQTDMDEIRRSEVLVGVTAEWCELETGGHTGGRHVELGYAMGLGRRVIVLGEPENVFHRARRVVRCGSVTEVLVELDAIAAVVCTERSDCRARHHRLGCPR